MGGYVKYFAALDPYRRGAAIRGGLTGPAINTKWHSMDQETPRREVIVAVPPEGEWGDAMRALPTDRQRAFVIAAVEFGTNDWRRCAKAAGFSGDNNVLSVTAHRLAHDDKILAAIREEAEKRLQGSGLLAVSVLTTFLSDTDKRIRMKAALAVMNRVGMHEKTEMKVQTEDVSETDENLIKQVAAFAKRTGIDVEKLLGFKPDPKLIVDAEFKEVEPDTALDPALEDALYK